MNTKIEQQSDEIIALLDQCPEGMSRSDISASLKNPINDKTLQRRLASLISDNKIAVEGKKRGTKYFPLSSDKKTEKGGLKDRVSDIFSKESQEKLKFLNDPLHSRPKMSYKREFLESYVPNETVYVPLEKREMLHKEGKRIDKQVAAGTYAQQICQRLLIDLSYNSSRLEGNTYSRLDTQKLLEDGVSAEGKIEEETVMIMNHKEAILFMIQNASEIEINRYTILNLHNLLSQDLLADPSNCGAIRKMEVDIGKSAYKPLSNPHQLEELFELILLKARKIEDPFEKSFFTLIHLSYLQAFEDVNKRNARLASNIPFIKNNLCPMSFTDVSRDDYSAALLTIYEKNEIGPMLDLYCWAYLRSCNQYSVVKESIGEIDGFRIQYRQQRKEVMGQIIRENLHDNQAEQLVSDYCQTHEITDTDKFTAMTLADLAVLHAGAIVGLGITASQLENWQNSGISDP